jgi:hypothetical protein
MIRCASRRGRFVVGVAAIVVVVVVGVVVAGCGRAGSPTPLRAAPEPAQASVPAAAPAGMVVALSAGSSPEGAVYDPGSGTFAVGLRSPDRIAVVTAAAGLAYRTVSVAASARHLELAAPGRLLVPGEDTNQIVELALPAGTVESTVATPKQPHDVAAVSPTDWYVADEFGGTVSQVVDGRIVASFGGKLQPGGAGSTGDTAVVVDVRARRLWIYRGGTQIGSIAAGAGPTHAVGVGDGRVVVADTTGGALLLDAVTGHGKQLARVALAAQPYGLAYDSVRRQLWVTQTGTNTLVRFDVTPHGLTRTGSWPTVQDAYSVAVDTATGSVLVVGEKQAQLELITP